MSTITKPFMFLVFVLAFVFFLDLVLLQVDINKTEMVLDQASIIVEQNEGNQTQIKTKLSELSKSYDNKYSITIDKSSGDTYLDGNEVVVEKVHNYISNNNKVTIHKSNVILNKQL